jgi:hypothetical protein
MRWDLPTDFQHRICEMASGCLGDRNDRCSVCLSEHTGFDIRTDLAKIDLREDCYLYGDSEETLTMFLLKWGST